MVADVMQDKHWSYEEESSRGHAEVAAARFVSAELTGVQSKKRRKPKQSRAFTRVGHKSCQLLEKPGWWIALLESVVRIQPSNRSDVWSCGDQCQSTQVSEVRHRFSTGQRAK